MQNHTVDKVNEKLPLYQLLPLGLQQVLAMYAGVIIVPMIIGKGIGMTPEQIAYLVAADLFTCGIATLIQSIGIGKFAGIRLPVILGCAFQAVAPMIIIGTKFSIGSIYGSIIASGIFVLIASYFFQYLLKFFPPVVIGSIITVIGLSLINVGIYNLGGGQGAKDFGSARNLLLGFFVLIFIIVVNRFFHGFFQSISVLLGIIVGTIIGAFMGMVDFSIVGQEPWFRVATPFYFGTPEFHFIPIVLMCIIAVISMIESTGVFFAAGTVCEKEITGDDVGKGLRAEGLAQIVGGVFNSFPYTTFSQNIGLIALTGVRSRFVVVTGGFILIILGMLPKLAAIATVIPTSVLGGAMIALFGMVAISGIRNLQMVDFSRTSNMLVAGVSIALGLGVTMVPSIVAGFPSYAKMVFESGIVTCSISAIILNLFLNWNEIFNGGTPTITKRD
ncbi:nucleobase:cation symporter-2 family protein [Clostridium cylindrosporum]|uniref:Xanthine permease PbuX n=1 Tax=Clostridium cylindrosporum DSM 605 TaxID=1121307 RepID=A0A0J8D8C2_CLOCY|nr:nucleobase:cation symporter-2 family protein [Clostridium cylindrosporum]KMT22117.1 xanthine permease PbuX [Clostridium cylindrosporum DSM 605]